MGASWGRALDRRLGRTRWSECEYSPHLPSCCPGAPSLRASAHLLWGPWLCTVQGRCWGHKQRVQDKLERRQEVMRPAPPSPPTSLGRGAQTRRASVQRHTGWAPCRAGNLSRAAAASLPLGRGTTPQTSIFGTKGSLSRGTQAFLIASWGSGDPPAVAWVVVSPMNRSLDSYRGGGSSPGESPQVAGGFPTCPERPWLRSPSGRPRPKSWSQTQPTVQPPSPRPGQACLWWRPKR